MLKTTTQAVQSILLLSLIALTGCNAQPPQPTLDPNMIYTAAAQTVQAQLINASAGTATAQASAAQATATQPAAPTLLATVPPANNLAPATTQVATLSINLTPGVTSVAPGSITAIPTLGIAIPGQTAAPTVSIAVATLPPTAAPPANTSGDKGQYVDQNPDDGTLIQKNTDWDQEWKIKNVGTTTWTTTDYYYARMVDGDQIAKKSWYFLTADVKPNTIGIFYADMKTPGTSGQYVSSWCLINKANTSKCIVIFNVTINVP
jgi:hypothetical protein